MKIYLIAATALLAGTVALAQPVPPTPPAPPIVDHVMTRADTVQMVRDHFARFDSDRNGAITTAEMSALHGMYPGGARQGENGRRMMGRMGDPNAAFDRLDANKDGAISRDEFAKGRQMRIEKRVVMSEKIKEAGNDGKPGAAPMHRMGGARMIVMADADKDGRITLSEAEAMALKHFDRMDANHDGQVTPDERGNRHRMMIREIRKEVPDAG